MGKGRIDERTPLIRADSAPIKASYKKTIHIYGITLSFLFLFSFFINWYRTILPTPLSDVEAKANDDFSGIHAYNEYLSHFTAPHSANTRENGVMRDWIASVATDLQKEAAGLGVQVDVIGRDESKDVIEQDFFTDNEIMFVESRNVIIRLNGTSGQNEALLVNAHYDSVPTSNGVTDNGMGVVTTMELFRYFVHNPPRHTIIFLLNNFEEGGLIGAKSFANHPWYNNVKLFINLEGAGAGGRAMLFRCTNLNAVKKLANSKAGFKHGSPFGNDLFKTQLLKSDTDYSVFTENGIPGLDIAFYAPRSHYHTPRDDLAHTTPEALQYMGQMALGAVRSIANSDDLVDTPSDQEAFVYYDILGRFMFAYSFTAYQLINALALLTVPAVSIYLSVTCNTVSAKSTASILKEKVCLILVGLAAVASALIFTILITFVSSFAMCKVNPSMTYGDVYGACLYTFVSAFLGLQLSQLILPNKLKQSLTTSDASWYGLISFWWIFVALASWAGNKGVASLFFAVYLLGFSALALLIHVAVPADKKYRSPLIFFTQTLLPFVLLMEVNFLAMDSMRHATADGTPEIAVYTLIAFPLILITLKLLPWVHVAGNYRKSTLATVVAFLFLFTICSSLQPFNGEWSPNKISFRQEYNAGDAFATVAVFTATALKSTLKKALPPHEYETVECAPFKTHLTRCTYKTDLLPKYGSNATLNEFVYSEVSKVCGDSICKSTFSYNAKNSIMCRVNFDPAVNDNKALTHAWINGNEVTAEKIVTLSTYIDQYGQDVEFAIEYPIESQPPKASLSCLYDEWTSLEIPAFTTLRDNLPGNALLLIRGQGLANVNYANITL